MQKWLIGFLILLSINSAENLQAAEEVDYNSAIEGELRQLSRSVYEFSLEKRLDTPEQQLAFFLTSFMILDYIGDEGLDYAIDALKEVFDDFAEYEETLYQSSICFITLEPFFHANEEFFEVTKEAWKRIDKEMIPYKVSLKPIRKEILYTCQDAATDALENALTKQIVPKEAAMISYQAVTLKFLEHLNKYAKPILNTVYEATLANVPVDLKTNFFRDSRAWNAFYREYFSELVPGTLVYFNPWKTPLEVSVFRKQILLFLLGHRDETSSICRMQRELIKHILKLGF